jgi:prepilin-type N-terminal cleavage/methylation domain-containing protein
MSAKAGRAGVTLVEMLVVLGVIALLMAVLLPAVLATRGAARKVDCTSHLKQLGLAVHGYHDSHRCFPPGSLNAMSGHVFLLPYIERRDLYDQVEFDRQWGEPRPGFDAISEVIVPLLQCPSDPGSAPPAGTNFALNFGTRQVDELKANGLFRSASQHRCVRDVDVTDGLSNTVAMAEVVQAWPAAARRARLIYHTAREYDQDETEAFIDECLSVPETQLPAAYGFLPSWTTPGFMSTAYNHVVPPNSGSCLNVSGVPSGILTPASEHAGGVSVLLGDGSVRFVSDGIARAVWQGVGTVAGGEAMNGF